MNPAPGAEVSCFQSYRNTYSNNPIGALQEKLQKEGVLPNYVLADSGGRGARGGQGFSHHPARHGPRLRGWVWAPGQGDDVPHVEYSMQTEGFGYTEGGFRAAEEEQQQEGYPGFVNFEEEEEEFEDHDNWCMDEDGEEFAPTEVENSFQIIEGFGLRRGWGARMRFRGRGSRGGFGYFTEAHPPDPSQGCGQGVPFHGPHGFVEGQRLWGDIWPQGDMGQGPPAHWWGQSMRGREFRRPGRGPRSRGSFRGKNLSSVKVTLPNGLMAIGTGSNKKQAKHNAARGMLDIMEGKASNVSQEMSQSISDGLKALRGGKDDKGPVSGPSPPKTFQPKMIFNESQQKAIELQQQQQQELIKQQIQYGPLGVKLWFAGDKTVSDDTEEPKETAPNRAPVERCSEQEEKKREKFFVQDAIHVESVEEFVENLILKEVFRKIDSLDPSSQVKDDPLITPDVLCKMCNLVFRDKKYCDRHKVTTDHLHVVKGFFPGEGGYHCFLCWLSFQQAEGLINHIGRENHIRKARKKGVSRVWMVPEVGTSLIDIHKDMKRRGRSRDRDRKKRSRSREKGKDRDRGGQHDDRGERRSVIRPDQLKWREVKGSMLRRSRSRERGRDRDRGKEKDRDESRERSKRREGGKVRDSKFDDLYTESIYSKAVSSYSNVLKRTEDEVKQRPTGSSGDDRKKASASSSGSHLKSPSSSSRSRHDKSSSSTSKHKSSSSSGSRKESPKSRTRETSSSKFQEKSTSSKSKSDLAVSNRDDSHHRDRSTSSKIDLRAEIEKKRRRSTYCSDHEEVNEIQDDFEIDSVGKVENSEETLQKMKSAIIGILDEEIFSLAKKLKK